MIWPRRSATRRLYHLLASAILLSSCYRDGTVERCAVTCNPLDNHCPGGLLCGTDSFCHGPDESEHACEFQQNDALIAPDVAIRDAPPVDVIPTDTFTSCPGGAWQANFTDDPTQAATGNSWKGTRFAFASDVTNEVWVPSQDGEVLTTTPPAPFTGLTLFEARVDAKVVDKGHVELHLEAGDDTESVAVDVDVTHQGSNQVIVVNLYGAVTVTQSATMSVDPHLLIGKLDYAGHAFKLFVDDASGGAAITIPTFAPRLSASAESFAVSAGTGSSVDDLGVCAM